jgi:Icc-related predicted phosphoesterase
VKLLITADLHYNLRQFDWVLSQASAYDAVILAGDLLDLGSSLSHEVQTVVVERYLLKLRQMGRILASSGNHDAEPQQARAGAGSELSSYAAQWMQHLSRDGIEVDGLCVSLGGEIKVSICPWWETREQQEQSYRQLQRDREVAARQWIWIHHVPPDQTPVSWTGKLHQGEPVLSEWMAEFEPDFVFCGHIHAAPFRSGGSWNIKQGKSWVFNAGCELGAVPTHLVVDLDAGRVAWNSSAGREEIELGAV